MRVLFLNGRLSERGGANRWLLGMLARLQSEVETLLAVGYRDRDFPAAEEGRIGAWVRLKGLDSRGLGEVRPPNAGLRRVVDEFRPDVIHANDVVDPDLLQGVADSGRGMQTVQDHRFFCPGRGKVDAEDQRCADPMGDGCSRCFDDADYGRRVIELTQRRRDALLRMRRAAVLSRYMADELIAVGLSPRRVIRIPPFVDRLPVDGKGDAAAGEFHLMAGRLSAHKGVHVALEAARRLGGGLPLVIAGDGPLADVVRSAARTSEGRVRFVGWADRDALADLFRRARSLWLPALWAEPFGIVGLEAMSRGVPVIASDGGGVRDWLVDGETGFAVEPGSAEQLARAADRLAADPSLAGEMGQRGIERAARQFDARAITRQLLDVYADFAACGRRPPPSPLLGKEGEHQ